MAAFLRNRSLVCLTMIAVAWSVALPIPTENPAEASSTKLQKRTNKSSARSRRSGRKSRNKAVSRPANYRSKNFLLHTGKLGFVGFQSEIMNEIFQVSHTSSSQRFVVVPIDANQNHEIKGFENCTLFENEILNQQLENEVV